MKSWGPISLSAGLLFPYPEKMEHKLETTSYQYIGDSNIKILNKPHSPIESKVPHLRLIPMLSMMHRNLYRPSFSRRVYSHQFPLSNECNVLAREQIFIAVRSSSILTSHGFFVSWDYLFSTHPRWQRTPGWAGRMMTLPLEISAPRPAHCIHWRVDTGLLKEGRYEFCWVWCTWRGEEVLTALLGHEVGSKFFMFIVSGAKHCVA